MRKLCIAIPTYNRCEELERALEDLLSLIRGEKNQNKIEILISNNGSTDNTAEVIDDFVNKFKALSVPVKKITNSLNLGFDKNLLNCFLNCEADYVWYLSDDDIVRSDALKIIFSDIEFYSPNCILYNFNQLPYNFNSPYIKENLYFDKVNENSLESISKIIHWPKMSSIVMKSAKNLNADPGQLDYKFMHVGLFCQIALSYGKILHSRKFIAGVDDKYLEKIDFLPFVANYMSETILKVFEKAGRKSLLKTYLDKFPNHYESPLNSCINFIIHNNRYGIPIKKQLQNQIKAIIYLEMKKSKAQGHSNLSRGLYIKYFLSYIEKIFLLHKLRKIYSVVVSKKKFINLILAPVKKQISYYLKPDYFFSKNSYSQYGEDLLIEQALERLRIHKSDVYYLDIGSNHPFYLSNTYYFYKNGSKGVCIEPDELLYESFKKKRPRDSCLNVGVSIDDKKFADFYLMTANVLNTFSFDEAEKISAMGTYKIKNSIRVPMKNINEIFENSLERLPNFISLDVEGLDLKILETIDFNRYRPSIFCIETLSYAENGKQEKNKKIIDFMKVKNYSIFADTYVNTIFVDSTLKEFN
jgi:FkbM family methyltransferase